MVTVCKDNKPCKKGQCCENTSWMATYQSCSYQPNTCYTKDGKRSYGAQCVASSECASKCCDWSMYTCRVGQDTSMCLSHTLNSNTNSESATIGLGVCILVFLSLILASICFCAYVARRRRQREGYSNLHSNVNCQSVPALYNYQQTEPSIQLGDVQNYSRQPQPAYQQPETLPRIPAYPQHQPQMRSHGQNRPQQILIVQGHPVEEPERL